MPALQDFAARIVDYAGLFPPAALPMAAVVRNYHKYLAGPHRWMLGRLVIPAARLDEFAQVFKDLFPGARQDRPWLISALVPAYDQTADKLPAALELIRSFNDSHSFARVDTVEGHLSAAGIAGATLEQIGSDWTVFLEIPFASAGERIAELAAAVRARPNNGDEPAAAPGVFAKMRTGGTERAAIPAAADIARFMAICRQHGLGFKATAGLHHPLCGNYRLTYDADAEVARMHGFVNVFVAAAFAHVHRWSEERLVAILEAEEPDRFRFDDGQLSFDGEVIDVPGIRRTRAEFAISFGSCSFTEPVDELQRPGWLASPANSIQ